MCGGGGGVRERKRLRWTAAAAKALASVPNSLSVCLSPSTYSPFISRRHVPDILEEFAVLVRVHDLTVGSGGGPGHPGGDGSVVGADAREAGLLDFSIAEKGESSPLTSRQACIPASSSPSESESLRPRRLGPSSSSFFPLPPPNKPKRPIFIVLKFFSEFFSSA